MIKKELRIRYITYCDECKNEINDHTSVIKHCSDGIDRHFHSMFREKRTCLKKFEERNMTGETK